MIEQTADRLYAEFAGRFSRPAVVEVIRGCIDDLAGVPRSAIPELGERLARQRLLDTLDSHAHTVASAAHPVPRGALAIR
ncbi:hypothetical protein [Nocardia wallacei]|uniref:Uncharacterized protein n=1 Tax=Nocardia wallacei TaxID=480035 RepID=A0A7G1KN77_9NOCA|nr:hypothetical protein [Nocardia wallacei]BCK56076.1 hypothetical protein NWFMUON74_38480 [Nocardia wallacei]